MESGKMNKQQLAARIWRAANKMRSKIEASEYKDFILGFIFYKYLSDQEVQWCKDRDWDDEDIKSDLNEDNVKDVQDIKVNLGYFIAYENLYSTWLEEGLGFSVHKVRTALSAFDRNIYNTYRPVYEGIFDALNTEIGKLGSDAAHQTKAITDLLELIRPIPTGGNENYDVIGHIYEYLIGNFAANAGKKAGEFYTPHEVAEMMSEIIAYHFKGQDEIGIYDGTAGSSSLLITVGKSISRANGNPEGIRYYAEELKSNTYDLTRMNLVMHGIKPANIVTRNADTLEDDWPLQPNQQDPLWVDACTSNPPYSQSWNPVDKDLDPRFANYGLAPKGKADYAFLLHELFHLRPGGIMTIVLPHGVLFRGDAEGDIRRTLIGKHQITAVIGLPANIFFGTGIPTIVMVLRKYDKTVENNGDGSILMIDASKGFVKDGKKNKLRACDIKRIVDAYKAREDIDGFCRVVPLSEIEANDYNLNIPRYIDSSEPPEKWDIYASMSGGIPADEVADLDRYWQALPGLREALFTEENGYFHARDIDVTAAIAQVPSVRAFRDRYADAFKGFGDFLDTHLIEDLDKVDISSVETHVADELFRRLNGMPLIDRYAVYQTFHERWAGSDDEQGISGNIEIIQAEGLDAVRTVDPHMVIKKTKKDNGEDKEEEVVDKNEPWVGRILPFSLVQSVRFPERLSEITKLNDEIVSCNAEIDSLFESLSDEEREGDFTDDDNTAFDFKKIPGAIDDLIAGKNPDFEGLLGYRKLLDMKADDSKLVDYIHGHSKVDWQSMKKKGARYSKAAVNKRIAAIREAAGSDKDSLIWKLKRATELNETQKAVKRAVKKSKTELDEITKQVIEGLSDEKALEFLHLLWVEPVNEGIAAYPRKAMDALTSKVHALDEKYATTYKDISDELDEVQGSLAGMLGDLHGSAADDAGIAELLRSLDGE